jgi:DNA-binding MarR family transcriptional regulator
MPAHEAIVFRQLTRAVFAAHASVLRYGDKANEPFGQSSARWRVMFTIAHGNGSVAGIARQTDYARQSVQRLADALVADELATYSPDPTDRRRQIITLTPAGKAMLTKMESSYGRWSKRLVEELGESNVLETIERLHDLKRVLDADLTQNRDRVT